MFSLSRLLGRRTLARPATTPGSSSGIIGADRARPSSLDFPRVAGDLQWSHETQMPRGVPARRNEPAIEEFAADDHFRAAAELRELMAPPPPVSRPGPEAGIFSNWLSRVLPGMKRPDLEALERKAAAGCQVSRAELYRKLQYDLPPPPFGSELKSIALDAPGARRRAKIMYQDEKAIVILDLFGTSHALVMPKQDACYPVELKNPSEDMKHLDRVARAVSSAYQKLCGGNEGSPRINPPYALTQNQLHCHVVVGGGRYPPRESRECQELLEMMGAEIRATLGQTGRGRPAQSRRPG
jgi:hypothetical protein